MPVSRPSHPPPAGPAPDADDLPISIWEDPRVRHGALVALGLALAVYFSALSGEFVFDDEALIVGNPLVSTPRRVLEILWGPNGPAYRPIRTLSYAFDYRIWELNPAGYHLSNVLYHGLTGLLVFIIGGLMGLSGPTRLLATALFAVHPIHTDAVTYVSGRRDVLSTLFYLCGFACFLRDRKRPGILPIVGLYVSYVLGIGSKEMAATLPAVCLAYHLTWGRTATDETGRGPLFYGVFFLVGAAFAYHAVHLEKGVTLARTYHGGSLYVTLLTMSRVFCYYVGLLVLPLKLSADYSTAVMPPSTGLLEPRTLIAVVGVLGCGILPFVWARTRPRAAFALFWYWLTLGPVSQIIPHTEMMAEHYLYLPSVSFCLAVGALLALAVERRPRAGLVATALVLTLFSVRTHVRNQDWLDGYTLWARTVSDSPDCARARTNLGLALEKLGRLDEAAAQYRRSLEILPDDPYTLSNYGSLLLQVGRAREARPLLQRAVERAPGYLEGHTNIGAVLCELGELKAAELHLRQALSIKPDHVSAMLNLGMTLRRLGPKRYAEAEDLYTRALEIDPGNPSAQNNLGALYITMKRGPDAVKVFERLVKERPDVPHLWLNLARAHVAAGSIDAARDALVRAAMVETPGASIALEATRLALDLRLTEIARKIYKEATKRGARSPVLEEALKVK